MSNIRVNTINDASGGSAAVLYGVASPPNSMGFRNRIINGSMVIDQRNAGASVTVNGNFQYPVDRMIVGGVASAGTFTAQQTATAPAGFTKAFVCTTGTADAAIAAGDYYFPLLHRIEGLNTADFGFGSASAQTITVSFWVRSNVTGTYPVALRNSGASRSYVATFTVNSANTFEYKTVTIPGDTSGTWLTDNGIGIDLSIGAIGGSAAQTTANAWTAGNFYTTAACTNWMATTGNTFYITGVQLEAGTVATPFERRDYGRELMMCQRYLPCYNATSASAQTVCSGFAATSTIIRAIYPLKVNPRVPPTGVVISSAAHFNFGGAGTAPSAITFESGSIDACSMLVATTGATANAASYLYSTSASAQIQFTGCEL